jgi:hypothetical protein
VLVTRRDDEVIAVGARGFVFGVRDGDERGAVRACTLADDIAQYPGVVADAGQLLVDVAERALVDGRADRVLTMVLAQASLPSSPSRPA